MAKMIEISAAEYERLQDCMRIAALIEENKALHQDVRRLRENIDKLRRPSAVSGWRWSVLKCRRSSTASAP